MTNDITFPDRKRIAIVDDDPIVREHFIEIVSTAPDLDLAGVAPTLAKARDLISLDPDLFLVDVGLPDGSGLDFIPVIKAECRAKNADGHLIWRPGNGGARHQGGGRWLSTERQRPCHDIGRDQGHAGGRRANQRGGGSLSAGAVAA